MKRKRKIAYQYKLNENSHKVLESLFFKISPILRRSGKWNDTDKILDSELYSTENFPSFSVDEIQRELKLSDVLMQDVCEYLELQKNIEVSKRLNKSIIKEIRATKLGFKAYKFEIYLAKNETLVYQDKFKKSVLWNNYLTPIFAALTLVVSIVAFLNQCQQSSELKIKTKTSQFRQQLQSMDNLKLIQADILHQPLTNTQKSSKQIDTVKTK